MTGPLLGTKDIMLRNSNKIFAHLDLRDHSVNIESFNLQSTNDSEVSGSVNLLRS